jgi:hypothetical protein
VASHRAAAFAERRQKAREEARKRAELQRSEQEELGRIRERDRLEDAAWKQINLSECAQPSRAEACDGLLAFLSHFPTSQHATEAKETLERGAASIAKLSAERDWTLLNKGCEGGDGSACESLADTYQSGAGVPRDEAKSRRFRSQACAGGVVDACLKIGQREKACELGDEASCNILCRAGRADSCRGASAELRQIAEETFEKHDAEVAIPKLMAQCSSDRANILHWEDMLARAQQAGKPGLAEQASAKLDELRGPSEQVKTRLQEAIVTVTGGYGARFDALLREARLRCLGHK